MRTRIFSTLATVTIAAASVVGFTSPASAGGIVEDVSVVQPGVKYLNEDERTYCTLGPAVQGGGEEGFLTAGHCGEPGDEISVVINGTRMPFGEFVYSDGEDEDFLNRDAALVKQTNFDIPVDKRVWGFENLEIAGGVDPETFINSGAMVCGVGANTGKQCARSQSTADTRHEDFYTVESEAIPGDSGGPAFAIDRNGRIAFLGVQSNISTYGGFSRVTKGNLFLEEYGLDYIR